MESIDTFSGFWFQELKVKENSDNKKEDRIEAFDCTNSDM